MEGSGFKDTPVSKALIFFVILTSILTSLSDTKHLFHLQLSPHLSEWRQFWRLATWQTCYTNSTEVLFAVAAFYQLRIVERLWGSRKFLSFLVISFLWTSFLIPLLATFLRPLTFGSTNTIPAGPTALAFALLAQFSAAIPPMYRYTIGTTSPENSELTGVPSHSLVLTSKSTSYIIPLQMALSQFPHAILPSFVGWAVGSAFRNDLLPGATWRVPGWLIGQAGAEKKRLVDLRRRLEEEAGGSSSGLEGEQESLRRR